MTITTITHDLREEFNLLATHPLQSFEWGEFREKSGVKVIRRGFFEGNKLVDGFQLTIHKIPKTPYSIGYFPKGKMPSSNILEELQKIGKEEKCILIQLEPNIIHRHMANGLWHMDNQWEMEDRKWKITRSAHPLFTKYSFTLDLTETEEELLKNMHSKTRYNIRVAEKHGVSVTEDNSDAAFAEYIRLTEETTTRQKFYAHTTRYHQLQWKTLKHTNNPEELTSHLLLAKYNKKTLVSWIVFIFKDTLYYPYGASSNEHREVMASNLMMWEAIKFGKKHNLKNFDMWGAADVVEPSPSHPYYGFHRFKQGYGAVYTEFIGSYDLIINPLLYSLYTIADKARWIYLRIKK